MRTSIGAVQAVLVGDYDGTTDLAPYLQAASDVVDQVVALASSAKGLALSTGTQELVERWLSAHFYTKMDPVYLSKNTGGAGGSFMRGSEEPYKDVAVNLDWTGTLNAILKRQVAGVVWLGKPVSAQVPYSQRD